jgi:hypothetical protein
MMSGIQEDTATRASESNWVLSGSVKFLGMEPKLTLPRPPGFGGIQPGESVELLFPIEPGRRVDGGGQGSRHAGNRMKRSKTRGRHIT